MVVGRRTGDLILNRIKVEHLSFVRPPIIITIVLLFHSYCRRCGGEQKDYDLIHSYCRRCGGEQKDYDLIDALY